MASLFVTLHSFDNPGQAYTALAWLQSYGIECKLGDDLLSHTTSVAPAVIGGIKIRVLDIQFELAKKILIEGGYIQKNEMKNKNIYLLNPQDYPNKDKCPYCQSENIDTIVNPNFLVVIFYFILGIIFPIFKSWEKCYDCGKEWKFKKMKK